MPTFQKLVMQTLGFNLRQLRRDRGWSQEEVAQRLGVTRVTIVRIEQGQTLPDWGFVCSAADLFQVSTDDLRKPAQIPAAVA